MSLTSSINNNLPYIALASGICFASILLYRIVYILTQSIINTVLKVKYSTSNKSENALKKYARNGFIAQTIQFASIVAYSCIDLFFTFCRTVIVVAYLLLPLVLLSLLLIIIEQRWTQLLSLSIETFNESLGPTLKNILAFPLNALEVLGTHIIPVFNLLFYILVRTPLQMLFSAFLNASSGSGYHLVQSLKLTGQSFPLLFSSIEQFVNSNKIEGCTSTDQYYTKDTNDYVCSNFTGVCKKLDPLIVADACLDSKRRTLDLNPMFTNLRLASGHAIMTIGKSCETVGMIANISLFPLSDPAFWNASSLFINSIINALVVAPITAYHRCQLAGGLSQRPAMCTPDFGPSFDFASDASVLLGGAITNWMDVLYLLVGELSPLEIKNACSASKDYQNLFEDEIMVQRMMGHNTSVLVRMSKDGFAITDGNSVIFVDENAGLRRAYAPSIWPHPVSVEYGIARTILPSGVNVNDDGIALFGCHCQDNETESAMKIECTTLTKSGNSWTFPVKWSLETEANILKCSRTRIVIQSIRKHSKRVSTAKIVKDQNSRFHKGLAADVAVYVIPICGDNTVSCFEEKYYTKGICFPYCMGLRLRHESFQPLMLRGATEWKEGVLVAERNCVLSSQLLSQTSNTNGGNLQTYCSTESYSGNPMVNAQTNNQENALCSYDSTCTSILKDKSQSIYSIQEQFDVPLIETINSGETNRLVLNGQPLVLGGGTFMRMYTVNGHNYIDFPTLVGNQYNEFTIEYHATIGYPVAQLSTTPSNEREFQNGRQGEIFVPVEYVQVKIPYNPGTISNEAMWYVTNPSYDWAAAFINYCATEGVVAQTQIMITSSYAPLTLWRVRYQEIDNLCYISNQGTRICQTDVSSSSPLDTEKEFPILSSKAHSSGSGLYGICKEKREFNLWVESVEDFDEFNIVIGVRRGTVQDMGSLLSESTKFQTHGKTVFYFIFKFNMTKTQVSIPFSRKDLLGTLQGNDDPSMQIFDTACPSLRSLPDVGGVVGHSIASVVHLFKTPVNLLLNPFAINELLIARYQKRCPENGLGHSMLENCGMSMVSLHPFFESVYTASHIFWETVSWVTQSVLMTIESSTEESNEMTIFKNFLQGGQIVGDASKLIVMFDIVRSIDVFDSKYQDSVEKSTRRRHLLSSYVRTVGGGLKKGASSIFSLSKSVFSAFAAAPFAGADLSILLATNDPRIYIVGSSVTAPSLAWVQFSYEAFLPIVLDLLANIREKKFTLQPMWVHIFQAYDKYDEIIHNRHLQACSGFRLMFGYSSKFGKGIYYNCLAAVSLLHGTLELVLNIFVDLPLYRCMCIHPAGENYVEYVYQNCEYLIPSTHRGKWQAFLMKAKQTNQIHSMCEEYFMKIEKQMYEVFDPWTRNSNIAVDNLGSFLNEMLTADTRSCNDINSNPTAIVLTPLPVHHFHVCSKTKLCRDKCKDAIEAFEYQYKRTLNTLQNADQTASIGKREIINVAIESPLFNKFNTDGSSLNTNSLSKNGYKKTIKAIKTTLMNRMQRSNIPEACLLRCNDRPTNICITVLSKQTSEDSLTVDYMCIPTASNILGTIFHTRTNTYDIPNVQKRIQDSAESSTLSHIEFSMHEGSQHILTYSKKQSIAINIKGEQTLSTSYTVHLLSLLGSNQVQFKRILRSEDIKERFLSMTMQEAIFGSTIINPVISNCEILEVIEIQSHEMGHIHMFLSFKIQIEASVKMNGDDTQSLRTDIQGHRIHASVDVCDDITATCDDMYDFFIPCTALCRGTQSACLALCRESVDKVLYMGEKGSFQHVENNTYFYLPSSNSVSDLEQEDLSVSKAGLLIIEPFYGIRQVNMDEVESNRIYIKHFDIANLANNYNIIGSWSRSQVFSESSVLFNVIRDSTAHYFFVGSPKTPITFFQVSGNDVSTTSEWLQQTRLELKYNGWTLKAYSSQKTDSSIPLYINCSIHSCAGCGNTILRLFCHAAQDCTLTKCIGTVIQTRNVLCGMGGFFEQTCNHAIVSWNAIYLSIAEIILIISKNMNANEAAQKIVLKFPTEQFYGLVCTCKEMYGKNIGLGLSVLQTLYANIFKGQMISSGGLDLSGKQDIGILVGEETLKSTSLANTLFNVITGSTLMPIMALHRWLICTANASLITEEEGSVSVQFEDVAMDKTWLPCARVNGISKILSSVDIQHNVESNIDMFVSFSMTLLSGLGETVLYAIQLSYESILDFFISVIWSIQDILFTFNLRSCKVPNYALRYVLWCSCNDTAYQIPQKNRMHKWDAFWCVGTLNMNLIDGTSNAIIYNPYSLEELSNGVKHVVAYIECVSLLGASNEKCVSIMSKASTTSTLEVLVKQGVEPISVWAKCKTNYLQNSWDVGSGAIFMETNENSISNAVFHSVSGITSIQTQYREWAKTQIGNNFLECMQNNERLQIDYSSCMRIYFDKSVGKTPNSYFIYEKMNNASNLVPDACLVFSGLNASAQVGSELQKSMHHCILQEGVSESQECKLNPSVWSSTNPKKLSVAKLHGTTSPFWTMEYSDFTRESLRSAANALYGAANNSLQAAINRFLVEFPKEEYNIDAMLFSADGDFIHEFFDCVFLGPYNRIDLMPCDREGLLDCPFYARDENGGKTRDFTACFGDIMYGDEKMPFTCGSHIRRSIIKYFYRNFSRITSNDGLSKNVSKEIYTKVMDIINNYTSENSRGCYNETSKICHLEACSSANGYTPCMNTGFEISEKEVGKFVIENILLEIEPFMKEVFTNPKILTSKYDNSSFPTPFQWENSYTALELSMFDPNKPIIKYDSTETYKMPLPNAEEKESMKGSIWGMCMSLISHVSMTVPVETVSISGEARSYELPVGAKSKITSLLKKQKETQSVITLEIIEDVIKDITEASLKSHTPFVWHKSKRHGPSKSNFCKPKDYSSFTTPLYPIGKLSIGSVSLFLTGDYDNAYEVRPAEGLDMPLYGFLDGTIAESNTSCVCAFNDEISTNLCKMQEDTCQTVKNHSAFSVSNKQYLSSECAIIEKTCSTGHRTYIRNDNGKVMDCLMSLNDEEGIRCPEMGPSDIWGYFPVDCSDAECDGANRWVGRGSEQVLYEGSRLLSEGRGGFMLPNHKHVLRTFHKHLHYGNKIHKPELFQIPECFSVEDLSPNEIEEQEKEFTDDVLKRLFPAAQLVSDSPTTSICTRYIIEFAKLQVLSYINQSNNINNGYSSQKIRVETWKRKCESKVRHMSMCNMMGIYFDVKPPQSFFQRSMKECNLNIQQETERFYMTPECIIVDTVSKIFYDAQLCAKIANRMNFIDASTDISNECALVPQPTDVLREDPVPYSMLFDKNGNRLLPPHAWIEELSQHFDLAKVRIDNYKMHTTIRNHVSYVLDWWPENLIKEGQHITSPTDPSELSPIIFDSHYFYDKEENTLNYVHTSLRNSSLLYNTLGSVGICRTHTIGMPMFEANTNRICTRISKDASEDTPTHPTNKIKMPGGNEENWPFSEKYMETYFEKEFCAESSKDVPWKSVEVASQNAGIIPGWNLFVNMDQRGRTYYDIDSNVFPPNAQILNDLYNDEEGWGPCRIHWKSSRECNTENPCVENAACLPVQENGPNHTCFSTRAYIDTARKDANTVREPCFATFQCPHGKVCLADGGCAPLYLHMWNPVENENPIEFTVLADACGFRKTNHPFTQNTRGASPWEQVPDILHAHGFCSHHDWFSYRNGIQNKICPIERQDTTYSYMKCNTSTTFWPWVFERFDKEKPRSSVNEQRQSMQEGNFLSVKPHICDQTFMHLQNPFDSEKKRLEVCSGFEGEEISTNPRAYFAYPLDVRGTWDNTILFNQNVYNSSLMWSQSERWLRTYKESTDEIEIGMIHHEAQYDTPFGFLGASKTESDVRGSMALYPEKTKFFRCESINTCGSPPHSYNGISVSRLSSSPEIANISEQSLRMCGSIGFISTSEEVCELDLLSFPLISFLLWNSEEKYPTCKSLFATPNFDSIFIKNDDSVPDVRNVLASVFSSAPRTFLCDKRASKGETGHCVFAARSKLSNEDNHINELSSYLNSFILNLNNQIKNMLSKQSATFVYEAINGCSNALMEHMLFTQSDLQIKYESLGPSGLYLALKLTLYEIPLAWFHHAMQISLLSHVYPKLVPEPQLETILINGKLDLLLWTESERTILCRDSEELLSSPLLMKIICLNAHPEYSFSPPNNMRKTILDSIVLKTQSDIQSQFIQSTEQLKVFCHREINWNCIQRDDVSCLNAQHFSHQTQSCVQSMASDDISIWLAPCKHPELFELKNREVVSLKDLEFTTENPDLVRSFEYFTYQMQNSLLRAAENIAHYVDYVKENAEANLLDNQISNDDISILRVWNLGTDEIQSSTQNFNITKWLVEDVCESKFKNRDICTSQGDILAKNTDVDCMYPYEFSLEDFMRYTNLDEKPTTQIDNASIIKVYYASGLTEDIQVCDLDKETETCFVQNLEMMTSFIGESSEYVPCGITGLEVPPGIEIKTYGLRLTEEEWYKDIQENLLVTKSHTNVAPSMACSIDEKFTTSQIYPCSWKDETMKDKWWYYGNVHRGLSNDPVNPFPDIDYVNRSNPTHIQFDDMNSWWPLSNDWTQNNKGCKLFQSGICSFKVRFENVPGISRAMCGTDSIPNCGLIINGKSSPFATSKHLSTDPSKNLYRCAPCTKMKNKISDDGMFGCFIGTNVNEGPKETLTKESVQSITKYLTDTDQFQSVWGQKANYKHWMNGSTSIEVRQSLMRNMNPTYTKSLLKWGKTIHSNPHEPCTHHTPSLCWKGLDMRYTLYRDQEIWNRAITNPTLTNTMICQEKMYTEMDARQCNSKLDSRRRKLSDFVNNHYRKRNGVWFQKVDRGSGSMWQSNVAHPNVNMFSIMYTSSNRPPREVVSNWVLGDSPCDPDITIHQDRICVSSTKNSNADFQTLHPWIGGDFNPFEGIRGLDECTTPKLFSGGQTKYLCPCKCEPSYACENQFSNYSQKYIDTEFYTHESCSSLKFPESHIMNKDDDSNLCSIVRSKETISKESHCTRRQGLFGGTLIRKGITHDELHSKIGIATEPSEFIIQSLFDFDNNGLWMGKTVTEESKKNEKYAFLKISRNTLNPAHIAFGIDISKSDWPLTIKAISLLSYTEKFQEKAIPQKLDDLIWLKTMKKEINMDSEKARSIYPQLSGTPQAAAHWSCPIRVFTFWGNSGKDSFSPLTPNPLLSNLIYNSLKGAHPFVPLQSLRRKLGMYKTTNGACFYQEEADLNTIPLSNADHPCGIKRMLRSLDTGASVIAKVMNHFRSTCQELLDHPNIGTELRSNFNERIEDAFNSTCGALHRLTPYLIRNKGDQGTIKKLDQLTTSSEGGDCHMGRAFVHSVKKNGPLQNIVGRHCSLIEKNHSHGLMHCSTKYKEVFPPSPTLLQRTLPLTVAGIISKRQEFQRPLYLDELNVIEKTKMPPTFFGPGRMKLETPEVSFGLLYTPSIIQTLAVDLRLSCTHAMHDTCTLAPNSNLWKGKFFLDHFIHGNLTQNNIVPPNNTVSSHYEEAKKTDEQLWNKSNWTWSKQLKIVSNGTYSNTVERKTYGSVQREEWLKNKFRACNSSFHEHFDKSDLTGELSVRNIPLCQPAPTSSLQNLCKSLLQYRQDIALINCQLMGQGDCLFNPGMFYLPYMWSVTNQEFSAETVQRYYEEVAKASSYTTEQFDNTLCPARNGLLKQLSILSRETTKQCPGNQIEYLKDTLETLKSMGYKLIYIGYSLFMFIISMLASLFSSSQEAISAAATSANFYLQGFIESISEIILPILDAFVSIIFGTSPAGKSIKEALVRLCEVFNSILEHWWVPQWCIIIKPSLYGIFQFLQGAASFFHSGAGDQIKSIWISIAGGDNGGSDRESCIAGFTRMKCDSSNDRRQLNESQFLVQPMATRCWADSTMNSGFSILTGNAQNDFLTCTVSDTCAIESTKFDTYGNYQNLIACASCPSVELSSMSNRFGCNTYLKRCTCGISSGRASKCITNSDCQAQELTICSLASNVDAIRTSPTTMPCDQCQNVGTEPTCVMDGVGGTGIESGYGVCACVSIFKSDSLQQCDTSMIGLPISLMRSTQSLCFISPDSLLDQYSTASLYVDFSALAIGPCIGNNFCLNVQLPITSSSGGGQFSFSYVVINKISYSGLNLARQRRRRVLLSAVDQSKDNYYNKNADNFVNDMYNIWCTKGLQYKTNQSTRSEVKECIHRLMLADQLIHLFNVTYIKDHMEIIMSEDVTVQYLHTIFKTPEILHFVLLHSNPTGLLPTLFQGTLNMMRYTMEFISDQYTTHNATIPEKSQNFNRTNFTYSSKRAKNENSDKEKNTKSNRKLLSAGTVTSPILPTISCSVIEKPLMSITNAFWDTVQFYKIKDTHTETQENYKRYNFIHTQNVSNKETIKERGKFGSLISFILGLKIFDDNVTGQVIIDSLASDIPYNLSVSNNLLTGSRLAKEITTCNYTLLTIQSGNATNLSKWLLILFITFFIATSMCCSSPFFATLIWIILFPTALFWIVYNVSPLCWPMIPPRFAKDLAVELLKLIPSKIEIPYFLIYEDCISTNRGKLDMGKQTECFKECSKDPFYMRSWQDPLAWWVCETSEYACKTTMDIAKSWNVLQDFSSSAEYFVDVLRQTDDDFIRAHRFCAFMTSYEITFALFVAMIIVLIIPSCIEFIVKVFSGAIVLLFHASNAEYTDDDNGS